MMRRTKRCVWALLVFSSLCAIYFLIVLRGEHDGISRLAPESLVRQALGTDSTTEGSHNCPVDLKFAASINKIAYGHPVSEKDRQVVYVSVPKCGSRTFVWVAWALKNANNISAIVNMPYLLSDSPESQMRSFYLEKLLSVPPGSLFHGHLRFMPFADPYQMPIYISMLRDPLSRHMSWYYFMRYGDGDMDASKLNKELGPRSSSVNESYDDCVQNGKDDCSIDHYTNMNIQTFCGYDQKCVKSPAYALEQAMLNVDRFLFVGIVEEYKDSLRVLEHLLPSMFQGSVREYISNKDQFSAASKTTFKREPEQKTVEIMKKRLKYDYEFYYYVQERFHKLKRHLGIGPCSNSKV